MSTLRERYDVIRLYPVIAAALLTAIARACLDFLRPLMPAVAAAISRLARFTARTGGDQRGAVKTAAHQAELPKNASDLARVKS